MRSWSHIEKVKMSMEIPTTQTSPSCMYEDDRHEIVGAGRDVAVEAEVPIDVASEVAGDVGRGAEVTGCQLIGEGRRVVDADDARREPVAEGRRFVMGVLGGTMSRARASLWTAAAARMHRSCAASTAASASSMLFRTASARSASFARVRGVRAGPSKETVFASASARIASRLVSASS